MDISKERNLQMKEVFLGEAIKQRRMELGLTQEQVCQGICEPVTISRIENGKQTPSRTRINAILQRLGLPDDRYFALLSKHEIEIENLQKEMISCNVQFERLEGEGKQAAYERGMAYLEKLEHLAEEDDRVIQQFILHSKALLGTPDGPYSFEERLDMVMRAIRLTVPHFDLENIGKGLYSLDEVQLIAHVAAVYANHGEHKKAVDILRQLLGYIQKHNQNILQSGGMLPIVAHNYALELAYCRHYEDAIEIAELGWQSCVKYSHYGFLPGMIAIMAECYHFLGDDSKSESLFYQAFYLYKAINNESDAAVMRKNLKQYFGVEPNN
jgi:transcriptional regulator with XRE-family HTH domain